MDVRFSANSLRQLSKLEASVRERIIRKIETNVRLREPLSMAEPLTDSKHGKWRFRIGDYRALFDTVDDTIVILKIGHRRDVYK